MISEGSVRHTIRIWSRAFHTVACLVFCLHSCGQSPKMDRSHSAFVPSNHVGNWSVQRDSLSQPILTIAPTVPHDSVTTSFPRGLLITPFAELLGIAGNRGSINVDLTLLVTSKARPHLRIGFWDDRILDHPSHVGPALVKVPFELGLLVGNRHCLEINVGYTLEFNTEEGQLRRDFTTPVIWAGYRFQSRGGGFFGRVGISIPLAPLDDTELEIWTPSNFGVFPGLSFGYTFLLRHNETHADDHKAQ